MSTEIEKTSYVSFSARILEPDPEAWTLLGSVRASDMNTFLQRMQRLCQRKIDRAKIFANAGILLIGAATGGAFGLIPFLSTSPSPSHESRVIYIGIICTAAVLALVCALARYAIHEERSDSISDIADDFKSWLDAYEEQQEGEQ